MRVWEVAESLPNASKYILILKLITQTQKHKTNPAISYTRCYMMAFYSEIMNEQEQKAKELYEMFYFAPDQDGYHSQNKYRAKVQASLCCNEIIKACEYNNVESYNSDWWKGVMQFISDI